MVLVLILIVLSACGAVDSTAGVSSTERGLGAEPTPTYDPHELNASPAPPEPPDLPEDFTPAPPPPIDESQPLVFMLSVTLGPTPNSPDWLVQQHALIVAGTVVEILPPQWTTPDYQRPDVNAISRGEQAIITPVVIQLDRPPLANRANADLSSGRVVVASFGGEVGPITVGTSDPNQRFEIGEQVLVGLLDHMYYSGRAGHYQTPAGPAWAIGTKYLLTEDGKAVPVNWHDEPRPAAEFIAGITAAAQAVEQPAARGNQP